MRDGRMHQTTVRFSPDLWVALEAESSGLGVSVAQYLREAAVARLAYAAGRRGDADYEGALVEAGVAVPVRTVSHWIADVGTADAVREAAEEQVLAARAVSAQSRLAWRRARDAREEAARLRRRRRENRQ